MSMPDYSPDGLTYEDITALQRDVTEELRREGHLPPPRRYRRRRSTRPSNARPGNARPGDAEHVPSEPTPRRRASGIGQQRGDDQ